MGPFVQIVLSEPPAGVGVKHERGALFNGNNQNSIFLDIALKYALGSTGLAFVITCLSKYLV